MPKLTLAETYLKDSNKGIVRVDLEALGIHTNGCLRIRGQRTTYARVWPAHAGDLGQSLIRTDPYIRKNASCQLGEQVYANKATPQPAERVVVRTTDEGRLNVNEELLKFIERKWLERFITKDDVIPLTIYGSALNFTVLGYSPNRKVVEITDKTKVFIRQGDLSQYVDDLYVRLITNGYRTKTPKEKFVEDASEFIGRKMKKLSE